MSKMKVGLIGALALTAIIAPALVQRKGLVQLREENLALRREIAGLIAERERDSNSLAQARAAGAISKEQLSELMKLRGELGVLRAQKTALEKSQKANEPTLTPTPSAAPTSPRPQAIAQEAWQFVGYATPENALQSLAWAMKSGNVNAFISSLAPEAQKTFRREMEGKSPEEIAALLRNEIKELKGLSLRRKQESTDDEVVFGLRYEEKSNGLEIFRSEAVMKFKNIGGEWKSTDTP